MALGIVVIAVLLWIAFMDYIPFAGRSKSCSVKEFRDKRVGWQSLGQTSHRSLTHTRPRKLGAGLGNRTVKLGFLQWEYHDVGVRESYRVTNSQQTPNPAPEACNCQVDVITNSHQPAVDLIIFSATDHGRAFGPAWCEYKYSFANLPSKYHKGLWGAWTFEHLQQFPQIADPTVLDKVDMQINYHPESTIPITWFCPREINSNWDYTRYLQPVPLADKRYLVAAVASRCRNDWQQYVDELRKHIEVQTYGTCWGAEGNHAIPSSSSGGGNSYTSKVEELAKSKFTLVFENTKQIPHYVSEKLSHALLAGTVPVIWGAVNIQDYLPSNHSAIIVSHNPEFQSHPHKLAKYLTYLHHHPQEYSQYFAWKQDPQAMAKLKRLTSQCYLDLACRVCNWIRKGEE
ncbi:hypothetical protein BASA81_000229 [Batrachochytrium salamandrivorans]|nr:hypothetical protein BASA81_000229 [Batrachochytrium salamandrivorans]